MKACDRLSLFIHASKNGHVLTPRINDSSKVNRHNGYVRHHLSQIKNEHVLCLYYAYFKSLCLFIPVLYKGCKIHECMLWIAVLAANRLSANQEVKTKDPWIYRYAQN